MANAVQNAASQAASTVTNAATHPIQTAKRWGHHAMKGMKIVGGAVLVTTLLAAFAPAAAVAGTGAAAAGTTSTLNTAVVTDYFKHNLIDKLPAAANTLTHAAQGAASFLGAGAAKLGTLLPAGP